MHTKINKQPNDSIFLTHVIWSKTKLGMQHIHLELLLILIYAIAKKNKHISRINSFDNYKIVINSPDKFFSKVVLMMSKKRKNAGTFIRHKHKEYMVLLQG
jgi:hypothetical protein